MADINQVIIIGRLTRDAELKYTQGGLAIGNFSIAVNRRKKSGDQWVDEVSYFEVSLFGKQAETLNQYMMKGKQVAVHGELRQDRWEQDGQSRSKVVIVANNVQLLGGNQGGSNNGGSGSYSNNNYGSSNQRSGGFQSRDSAPQQDYDMNQSYPDSGFPEEIPF